MISQNKKRPTAKARLKKPAAAKAKPSHRTKQRASPASHPEGDQTASLAPVVVEAGSRSESSLRRLEEGTGPLIHEVDQIVHAIHAAVPGPVPIVIVYREKRSHQLTSPAGLFF